MLTFSVKIRLLLRIKNICNDELLLYVIKNLEY